MNIYKTLNKDGMIDFCCIADYRRDSILSQILQRQKEKSEISEEYTR